MFSSYQFKGLADKKMYSYMILLFSIFSPGFTFLYLTDNALFCDIDIIKLIILSIIYTIPLIIICLLDSLYEKENYKNKRISIEDVVLDTNIKTILFLYAFIFIYSIPILSEKFSAIELFYGLPMIPTIYSIGKVYIKFKKQKS